MRSIILAVVLLTACTGDPMCADELPIACSLDRMSAADRAREAELLEEHRRSFVSVVEEPDGFAYTYPDDPALFARMAELVSIEHRCCPFLAFRLEWGTGDTRPVLHVGGGERVKSFVREALGQ